MTESARCATVSVALPALMTYCSEVTSPSTTSHSWLPAAGIAASPSSSTETLSSMPRDARVTSAGAPARKNVHSNSVSPYTASAVALTVISAGASLPVSLSPLQATRHPVSTAASSVTVRINAIFLAFIFSPLDVYRLYYAHKVLVCAFAHAKALPYPIAGVMNENAVPSARASLCACSPNSLAASYMKKRKSCVPAARGSIVPCA